ncbi:MAG: penicillin acylase family protein [candidate division Zixibacteria bacterium]|nr:penicillin acylase family protein [candidate division Zixibacteria bacterium]
MNHKLVRLIKSIGVALAILVGGIIIAAYLTLRSTLPPTSGEISLVNIRKSVEITFDSMGIAQIWAETEHDGFFAMGWQHAADRLFQMDLTRRVSQGRLSEMLGEMTLDFDIQQRRIGHHRIARQALQNLSEPDLARLQAYADGVNAYVLECDAFPFEFYLLPVAFEEWTVYDCLTILSFKTWYSDALQNRDDFFVELSRKLPSDIASDFLPEYPSWAPVTADDKNVAEQPRRLLPDGLEKWRLPSATAVSNAWIIGPDRSHSGKAMLASDPHLEITRLPQFWYAIGLHIEETNLNAFGIGMAGVPLIVMGHNGQAGWTFTAGGVDITDYYQEIVNPDDSTLYLVSADADNPENNVWDQFVVYEDTLRVSGQDSTIISQTRWTRHGPIIPELADNTHLLSWRWAGYDCRLEKVVAAGFELMRVRDFEIFRSVVTNMGALDANWLYADSSGMIGYQLGTPVPKRPNDVTSYPLPGWTDQWEWDGFLPLDETPHAQNPPCGWLASCNNNPGGSVEIQGSYAADRILRATELLAIARDLTIEDMHSFQIDIHDEYLLRWKNEVASLLNDIGDTLEAEAMRSWDGSTDLQSRQTALLVEFLNALRDEIFADDLDDLAGRVSRFTVDRIYHDTAAMWIDDQRTKNTIESREDIGARAMRRALETTSGRSWGQMHSLTMRHPMGAVPVLGSMLKLARGPWPWAGTSGTLNSSFTRRTSDGNYRSVVAPSWRMVIDFANTDSVTIVLPAGNSGNPVSSHFFDFNELWQRGDYWVVPFSRAQVQAQAASVMVLRPPSSE